MKNLIKKILISIVLISSNAYASTISINQEGSGMPIIGELSISFAPSYYTACVLKIHSKNFGDMAMDGGYYGIVPTMEEFQDYEDKLLEAIDTTNKDKVNNITEIFSNLKTHLLKTSGFNNQQQAKLDMQNREVRMEYKANLEKDIENFNHKIIKMGNSKQADKP